MSTSIDQWPALVVTDGRQAGQSVTIRSERVVVGCSPEVDFVVEGRGVARRHAEVFRGPEGILVRDLGSPSGTGVNGEPIAGPVALQPGDRVSLGEVTLRLGLVMAVNSMTSMDLLVPPQRTPDYDVLQGASEPPPRPTARALLASGLAIALAGVVTLVALVFARSTADPEVTSVWSRRLLGVDAAALGAGLVLCGGLLTWLGWFVAKRRD